MSATAEPKQEVTLFSREEKEPWERTREMDREIKPEGR